MPRHFNLLKLLLPVFILGCSSKSDKDNVLLKELTESIETSSISIQKATETSLSMLIDKLKDLTMSQAAKIYEPKAKVVYDNTQDLYNYLNTLIFNLKSFKKPIFDKNGAEELYKKLEGYKEKLFAIDPQIKKVFDGSLVFTTREFDSGVIKKTFSDYFFKDVSFNEAIALLAKFQNNIRVIENKIVNYYNLKSSPGCILDFSRYAAIIGQSSSIVKGGEELSITVGVGSFSRAALPEIFINNKKKEINENNVAVTKIKASLKSGAYEIPVIIKFTDQDGKKQIIEQTVEYTVSDCKNQ